jgi:hypothetical protein
MTSILQLTYGMYRTLGIQNTDEYCIAYTTQEFIQKIVFLGNERTIQNSLRRDILKFNHRLYENITIIHEWENMLRYINMFKCMHLCVQHSYIFR